MAKKENVENAEDYRARDGSVANAVEEELTKSQNGTMVSGHEPEVEKRSLSDIEALSSELVVGGYNMNLPPRDDVCPICFGDFRVPCKTSCGHWFCAICILRYLQFSEKFKHRKCPLCRSSIAKLIPESSNLLQHGQEVGKILKEIQQYNHLNAGGGWHGLIKKAQAVSMIFRGILRRSPAIVVLTMRSIGQKLGDLYDHHGSNFFPNGARGINLLFSILCWIIIVYRMIKFMWSIWRLWRAWRFARLDDGLQHMD